MNKIEIFNETKKIVENEDLIKEMINYALDLEKVNNGVVNLIIVDNAYIKKINKEYRNKDVETDVISFALEDEKDLIVKTDSRLLGDIYISIDKIYSQAQLYNHSVLREFSFLSIHGLYHLLGYDHQTKEEEKIMFQKQEEVLKHYEITR